MATIRRRRARNALDDLAEMQELAPEVERMVRQIDTMRPLIEAVQRQQDLVRQLTESVRFNAPALEAAKRLTAVTDAVKDGASIDTSMLAVGKEIAARMDSIAALKIDLSVLDAAKNLNAVTDAMKDAMRVDTSVLDIGKTIAAQMDGIAAMKAAFEVDTGVLEAAKNLTRAGDAVRNAIHIDTSALSLTKALAAQMDTAAEIKAAFQIDTAALDWAKTIAPHFEATRSMVTALQRAVPEFPKLEISAGVQEAMRSLSAMNIAPQLAAILEPPASIAALMREAAATYGTSFAVPQALREAQLAAESIASSIRLADLDPERFGVVFTEGEADAAWFRLMARAQAIAADEEAGPEAVIAFAEDADAVSAAVSPEARGRTAVLIEALVIAVIVELLLRGLGAGAKALLPYLVALPLSFQPPLPPALPPAPAPFGTPALPQEPGGALGIPRAWEMAGLPAIIRRAGPEAERRTIEFFETGIANRNTRQAYAQAIVRFMTWCEDRNLELGDITVFTVAAHAEEMTREYAPRTVRQHLGAIRGLFDHLVAGKVVPVNPASPVRGPRDEAPKKRSKAVLQPQEIRLLLDSIDDGDCAGLRDRAVIAMMAYGLARVSAVTAMNVEDCFMRDGAGWLRLADRNGAYEIPLHTQAKTYLDAYLGSAGIAAAPGTPLWRTVTKERNLSGERMSRVDVFRMVKRRLRDAGLPEAASCESIRAAGIASYLANGGVLGRATVQVEPGAGLTPAEIARIAI